MPSVVTAREIWPKSCKSRKDLDRSSSMYVDHPCFLAVIQSSLGQTSGHPVFRQLSNNRISPRALGLRGTGVLSWRTRKLHVKFWPLFWQWTVATAPRKVGLMREDTAVRPGQ